MNAHPYGKCVGDKGRGATTYTLKLVMIAVAIVSLLFLVIVFQEAGGTEVHKSRQNRTGKWSPVTANVNWCEADYVVTVWLAEFWNTLSSVAFIVTSVVGLVHAWPRRHIVGERRWIIAHGSVLVVGIGSLLYHATLRRSMQMLDELPMVYAVLTFLFICNATTSTPGVPQTRLMTLLTGIGVLVTVVYLQFPEQPAFFQLAFGLMTLWVIVQSSREHRRASIPARQVLEVALLCFVIASFAWVVEPRVCTQWGWLQLHSWWHVLANAGIYGWLLYAQYHRMQCICAKPKLRLSKPLLVPIVDAGVLV